MDERDGDDPVDPVDSEDSQVGIGESTYMEWIIDGGGDLFFFGCGILRKKQIFKDLIYVRYQQN